MRKCMWLTGGIALTLFVALVMPASGQKTDDKDAEFIKEAAMGGMCEIKLGQLALEKASNKEVRGFAQRMIDDHSKANKELAQLAQSKNVMLAKDLSKKGQALSNKMDQLQGLEFDRQYMRQMVEDHEEDVGKFEQASKFVKDPDLKAWVVNRIPMLKEHLQLAKAIHAKVEKAKN